MRKTYYCLSAACLMAIAGLLTYVVSQYLAAFRQVTPVPTLDSIILPYVTIAAFTVSGGLFVLSFAQLWREWRRKPFGHCQKCGYNLTGNTSGVCPECGRSIPQVCAQDVKARAGR